jgi:hypothetical protein
MAVRLVAQLPPDELSGRQNGKIPEAGHDEQCIRSSVFRTAPFDALPGVLHAYAFV